MEMSSKNKPLKHKDPVVHRHVYSTTPYGASNVGGPPQTGGISGQPKETVQK
jgi:hypothetical protein